MKVFAVAVLFLCSISAPAQTFRGSISGTLSDSTGAALPEATVKLDSPATGLTRTVVSSATGEYLFPDLPVGTYSITATHPGFAAKKIDNIEVAVSKVTNLNIQLGIAQQQQVVEVSATAVTLETTSTALVGVVNTKTVADLPMNGRDFRQMIKLAPGVSPSTTSVNGMRTSGNNYQIDGADNNDAFQNAAAVNQGGVSGIAGTLLPIEAIDQFSVQSNAGAEVGRNGGSSINLVIKSGTNDLHGSLYYFNRNEALASRSPFQSATSPKAVIRNNQFGFSLGGPIKKNRTFYFVNGESQLSIANNTILDTIPSDAWVTQAKGVLAQYGVPGQPGVAEPADHLAGFHPHRRRHQQQLLEQRPQRLQQLQRHHQDRSPVQRQPLDFRPLLRRHGHPDRRRRLAHPRLLPGGAQPHAQLLGRGERHLHPARGQPVDPRSQLLPANVQRLQHRHQPRGPRSQYRGDG